MRFSLLVLLAAVSLTPFAFAEPPSVDTVARRIDLIQDVYGNRVEHMGPAELEAAYRSIDALVSEWNRLGKLAVWTDEGLGSRASATEVGGVDLTAIDAWRTLQLNRLRSIPLNTFTDLRSDVNALLKANDAKSAVALLHLSPLLYWGDSQKLTHKDARERIEWGADIEETGRLSILYLDYFEDRLRDSATYALYDSKAETLLPHLDKVSTSPELIAALTPVDVASITIEKRRRVESAFRRPGVPGSHGYLEGVHFYSITRGKAEKPAGWVLVAASHPGGFNPEFRKPVPYIVETSLSDLSPLESKLLIRAIAAAFESKEVYLPKTNSLLAVDGLKTKDVRAVLPRGWITADHLQRAGSGGPLSEEVLEKAITVSVESIGPSITADVLPPSRAEAKVQLSENANATLGALQARISRTFPGTEAFDNLSRIPSFKEVYAAWDIEYLIEHNPPNGQPELTEFFRRVLKLRADLLGPTAQRVLESLPADQHIWCIRGIALSEIPESSRRAVPPIVWDSIRNAFASENEEHREWASAAAMRLGDPQEWPKEVLRTALMSWENQPGDRGQFPLGFVAKSLKALREATWATDPDGMRFVRVFLNSGRPGAAEEVAEQILTSPAWKKAPGIYGLVRQFMELPHHDTYVSTFPDFFFGQEHWAEDPQVIDYLLEYVLRRYTVEQVAFTHYVLGRSLKHAFWAEAPHGTEALEILLRGYRRQVWWDTGDYDRMAFEALTSEAWMKRLERDFPEFQEWKRITTLAMMTHDWSTRAERQRAAIDWLKSRFEAGFSFRGERITREIKALGVGVQPANFLQTLLNEMPSGLFSGASLYTFLKANEEAFERGGPNDNQRSIFKMQLLKHKPAYDQAQKRSLVGRLFRGCKDALAWLAGSRKISQ